MSIKTKLVMAMFMVGLLVAGPAGALFYVYTKNIQYRSAMEMKREDLRKMAIVVADNMEASDFVPIMNYIKKMKSSDSSLRGITLADKNGFVVADTDSDRIGRFFSPKEVSAEQARDFLAFDMDVKSTVKKNPLGKMLVRYDRETIEQDARRSLHEVAGKIVWIALTGLLIGMLSGLVIALGIAKPLVKLARESAEVGAGNLEIKLEPRGKDEVARVTKAVKEMVGKLKVIDEMKDEFVNNVSHDLRSPLGIIKTYVAVLLTKKHGELGAEQAGFIKNIAKAADRLSNFVNNMLDTAKIKAGRFELDIAEENLYDIAHEAVNLNQQVAAEKKIELTIIGARENSGIKCDIEAIRRVLMNLISNAVKFTPESGRILVEVKAENGGIRCEVRDTGPGVSEDELTLIFRRFVQSGDPARADKKKSGTGLGLSICREIIELHGGKIWAESKHGNGSAFIFILKGNHVL
ncbi:MAG: HAMP domain-containing sensor histidine kinase [Elusimicrobiota bacterium]